MTLPIEWEFDIVRARHSTMLHTTSSCLVHKNRRRTWTDRCHYKNINLRTRRLAVLNKNLVLPPWYFSEAIFSTSNNHYTTHPLSRNILEGIQIIAYQKMLSVSLVYDPTETLQTWPYRSSTPLSGHFFGTWRCFKSVPFRLVLRGIGRWNLQTSLANSNQLGELPWLRE